jgi:hypothetical protein
MINKSFIKNVFILLILTRLVCLEENQLILIAEILGSIVMLMTDNGPKLPDDLLE